MLAVRHLKREQPPSDLRADGLHANAGLFPELPACRLFERFAMLDAAARRGPVILTRKSAGPVDETKQQHPPERIENQQSGGWTRTHANDLHDNGTLFSFTRRMGVKSCVYALAYV